MSATRLGGEGAGVTLQGFLEGSTKPPGILNFRGTISRTVRRLSALPVAGLVALVAAPAPAPGAPPDWQEIEAAGNRLAARAGSSHTKALESWQQVEQQSLRNGNAYLLERARQLRVRLLLLRGDDDGFRARSAREGPVTEAGELRPLELAIPSSRPEGPPGAAPIVGVQELEELVRFFTRAGRAYFLSAGKESRDLPLLFEALALAHRLVGDSFQVRADAEYRKALALLEAAGGERTPEELVARGRLHYRLREFSRAYEICRGADIDDALLGSTESRFAYLSMARNLARHQGDARWRDALNERLRKLGKREEQPPPLSPFPSLVTGRAADLARAARTLLDGLRVWRLDARDRSLVRFLAGLATLEAGEPALALEILERIDPEDCGGSWLPVQVAVRTAEARERAGDHEGALASYDRARELPGIGTAPSLRARIHLNRAALLLALGNLEGARGAAREVLEMREAPPDIPIRARLLLGDVLYFTPAATDGEERRLVEDARAAYGLAAREIQLAASAGKALPADLRVQILIHRGNASRRLALLAAEAEARQRHRQEAIGHAEAALGVARDLELSRLASIAAANLGELHLEAGNDGKAREFTGWALERARKLRYFEAQWRCHWYLGRIADGAGDGAAADGEYARAAAIIERYRSRIIDARLKAGFMSTKQVFFQSLVRRHVERGNFREAFAAAERARSRAFIETLGMRFLLLAGDRDREIYRDYIGLLGRAEEARSPGGELFGVSHRGAEDYEELRERIEKLRKTVRESRSVSPVVHALVEGSPAEVSTVQQYLRGNEVLLEYFSTGESLVAFVVGRTGFRAVDLRISPREVGRRVEAFLDSGAGDRDLGADLHRRVIAPVEPAIEALGSGAARGDGAGRFQVTAVPWGPLHRLPLEALVRGNRYLVEDWELAYLPSGSVMRYVQREPGGVASPTRLVAFVDPDTDYNGDGAPDFPELSFARREVKAIAPLFDEKTVLEGKNALEAACVRMTPAAEVVHMACHGEFFPSRPMTSTLYLSQGNAADGRLKAAEIFGIDFRRSRLVTLSGCETGRIDVGPGDDPVGIGTAFLHSGARALLVSLWKVEDEATAALMQGFYRAWVGGTGSRASALREAKLELIRAGAFVHPRQWASFVLIGIR